VAGRDLAPQPTLSRFEDAIGPKEFYSMAEVLALRVPVYDAQVHYQQVRDSWAGVRTPDGR